MARRSEREDLTPVLVDRKRLIAKLQEKRDGSIKRREDRAKESASQLEDRAKVLASHYQTMADLLRDKKFDEASSYTSTFSSSGFLGSLSDSRRDPTYYVNEEITKLDKAIAVLELVKGDEIDIAADNLLFNITSLL